MTKRPFFTLVAACALVAACSSTSGHGGNHSDGGQGRSGLPRASSAAATPPELAFDPPLRFADQPTTTQGAGVYSDDGLVFQTDGSIGKVVVSAVELHSGQSRWQTPLTGYDNAMGSPVLGSAVGKRALFFTYDHIVHGSGTALDHRDNRLVALAADNGKVLWQRTLPEPKPGVTLPKDGQDYSHAQTVAADATTVIVVTTAALGQPLVIALDTATGHQKWTSTGWTPKGIGQGVVAGIADSQPGPDSTVRAVGYTLTDGTPLWHTPPVTYDDINEDDSVGGANFAVQDGVLLLPLSLPHDEGINATVNYAIDLATGNRRTLPYGTCIPGTRNVIICSTNSGYGAVSELNRVTGIDTVTGKELWHIDHDEGNRVVPTIRCAYDGAVYADEAVLDARTGRDKQPTSGPAPDKVIRGYAIDGGTVYPAIG